jgi:hypothetical protein
MAEMCMQGGIVVDRVGRPQDLRGLGLDNLGGSAMSTRRSPRARMVTTSSLLRRPPSLPPPVIWSSCHGVSFLFVMWSSAHGVRTVMLTHLI